MTPSLSCGGYKELHAGQHAYMIVFGTPSIFQATLILVGKVQRNSSSVGDKLLLIVFLKSSFSDLSLKLLEFRVEWSRLSWTSTWNKVCCKNELHSSKERIKSLSVVKVSMCCMLMAWLRYSLGFSALIVLHIVTAPAVVVSTCFTLLISSILFRKSLLRPSFTLIALEPSWHQRTVTAASMASNPIQCALISSSRALVSDNASARPLKARIASVWDMAVHSSWTKDCSVLGSVDFSPGALV